MALLEVKDLQVYYGVIQALKGISFEELERLSFVPGGDSILRNYLATLGDL